MTDNPSGMGNYVTADTRNKLILLEVERTAPRLGEDRHAGLPKLALITAATGGNASGLPSVLGCDADRQAKGRDACGHGPDESRVVRAPRVAAGIACTAVASVVSRHSGARLLPRTIIASGFTGILNGTTGSGGGVVAAVAMKGAVRVERKTVGTLCSLASNC